MLTEKERRDLEEIGKNSSWMVSWCKHLKTLPLFEQQEERYKEMVQVVIDGDCEE